MRACPKCSLVNPDSAIVCDCGFAFDPAAAAQMAPVATGKPFSDFGVGVKLIAGAAGFFVGLFISATITEIAHASVIERSLMNWGWSIGGAIVAVRLTKRRQRK